MICLRLQAIACGLTILLLALSACRPSGAGKGEAPPPNIILIQADDLGWDDLAIHDNPYVETPALDRLAREGAQFRRFYLNSVCAPTRASLLTGRHFLRTGVSHVHGGKDFVNREETLLPEALRANGYRTGMWGKWHSGKTAGYFPWERGFDEAYMAQLYKHENSRGDLNGRPVEHQKWASEVITDYAIDFIRRRDEQPFFAYLSYLTVHAPLRAPAHLIDKYRSEEISENLATLYAMIDQMDSCINVLLMELERQGLADNTAVLFISDNGPAYNGGALTVEDRDTRYVSGLKGHKGNLWENGVKSPLFFRWPQSVQPAIDRRLVSIVDLYPTLVELAGGVYPDGQLPLDGQSFARYFADPQADNEPLVFDYVHLGWADHSRPYNPVGIPGEYDPVEKDGGFPVEQQLISVQRGPYKLMQNPFPVRGTQFPNYDYILVNVDEDPRETVNLAEREPALFDSLRSELHGWMGSILREPHALRMPEFQIDAANAAVLGYAPRTISGGLTNTGFYLSGWERDGQRATYALRVREAGSYTLEVHFSEVGAPFVLTAGLNGQSAGQKIEKSGATTIGAWQLPAGPHQVVLQNGLTAEGTPGESETKLIRIELRKDH